MLKNMMKLVFGSVFCLCMTSALAETMGGIVNITVTTGGAASADTTVVVRSWVDGGFEVFQKSDTTGKVTINGVPVGGIDVFAMDNAGNVTSKFAGEISSSGEQLNVALDQ